MPDDQDYEWLAWLLAHPADWSAKDASQAQSILVNQRAAFAELHPKDEKGRRTAQQLIDELEAAISAYGDPG